MERELEEAVRKHGEVYKRVRASVRQLREEVERCRDRIRESGSTDEVRRLSAKVRSEKPQKRVNAEHKVYHARLSKLGKAVDKVRAGRAGREAAPVHARARRRSCASTRARCRTRCGRRRRR